LAAAVHPAAAIADVSPAAALMDPTTLITPPEVKQQSEAGVSLPDGGLVGRRLRQAIARITVRPNAVPADLIVVPSAIATNLPLPPPKATPSATIRPASPETVLVTPPLQPATVPGTAPADLLDVSTLRQLMSSCDFIGISAYAAQNSVRGSGPDCWLAQTAAMPHMHRMPHLAHMQVDFAINELQNSAFTFYREFEHGTGIDLAAMMEVGST
jgi:hypothetical protein